MSLFFIVSLVLMAILPISVAILITGNIDEKLVLEEIGVVPSKHDIFLMDLPIQKLKTRMKEMFNFEYNSAYDGIGTFPINGVILEDTKLRLVIPIVARYKNSAVQTSCVLDIGSAWTFFSQETFHAMGIKDVTVSAQIAVHGLPIPIYVSTNHFVDINVCGQSFLSMHLLTLIADYKKRKVVLEKPADLTLEEIDEL